MPYVDGFVLLIPKKHIAAYRRMAQLGAKVWRERVYGEFKGLVTG